MPGYETLASDALERIARLLRVPVDLDAPEPALIASVERAVFQLVTELRPSGQATSESLANSFTHFGPTEKCDA